jgi:hypothetical protein
MVMVNGKILSTTKVPWPGLVITSRLLIRDFTASRTVFLDAWYCSLSSSSVGNWVPGASSPDAIR